MVGEIEKQEYDIKFTGEYEISVSATSKDQAIEEAEQWMDHNFEPSELLTVELINEVVEEVKQLPVPRCPNCFSLLRPIHNPHWKQDWHCPGCSNWYSNVKKGESE